MAARMSAHPPPRARRPWGRLALGIACMQMALPAAVAGEDVLAAIRQRLGNPPVVRGEFEQKKTIPDLAHPLVSRGRFVFSRERGVIWQTRTPVPQTLRVTRDGITQERDGNILLDLPAKREPAIQAINEVILSLFRAEFSRLESHFRVAAGQQDGHWRIELTPTSSTMSRAFRRIRLAGADHIQQIELIDAHGDRTETRFSGVQVGDELSDAEAQQLR